MKILIMGGARHSEWVDGLPDGVRMWVDIRNATSHVIRTVTSSVTDLASGEVKEAYVIRVAVHPDLTGPQEPQLVGSMLNTLAMNEFARAYGEAQEIPKEPALEVPSDHRQGPIS